MHAISRCSVRLAPCLKFKFLFFFFLVTFSFSRPLKQCNPRAESSERVWGKERGIEKRGGGGSVVMLGGLVCLTGSWLFVLQSRRRACAQTSQLMFSANFTILLFLFIKTKINVLSIARGIQFSPRDPMPCTA